jgi:hypothetical protein
MAEEPPFYVGYLPLPRRLRPFLLGAVGTLLIADIAVALAALEARPAHPSGAWGTEGEVAYRGLFQARPYPLLRLSDRTVLLVSEGKHGAPPGLEPLDGALVEAKGYPILRGDLTILQLDQMPSRVEGVASALPPGEPGRPARLAGELVDSKCYAGAMNPGEGKTHKGCASLCVFGGIPPLLVVRGAGPDPTWYILADPQGGPLNQAAAPLVGEAVELGGSVVEAPFYRLFEIAPGTLEALQ